MKRSKGILRFSIINVVFFLFLSPLVIFYGPFNSLQLFAVGAIATSRHVQNVDFFLTKEKYEELIKTYSKKKLQLSL